MNAVRPAAVAGMFYPGDARTLAAEVDDLLGGVEQTAPRLGYPKALVVPHAGYIYSGGVAARAYDELAAARGSVRRVVLLGPTHRVRCAARVPGAQAFATPLGQVRIDRDAIASVRDLPQVVVSDAARMRSSIRWKCSCHSCRKCSAISRWRRSPSAWPACGSGPGARAPVGRPETLIVISTDMSHYHCVRAGAPSTARLRGSRASPPTSIMRRPAAPRP